MDAVLVHCNAGVSRAPTVVIAFLMIHQKLNYKEAFELVKKHRQQIKLNEGFKLEEIESGKIWWMAWNAEWHQRIWRQSKQNILEASKNI